VVCMDFAWLNTFAGLLFNGGRDGNLKLFFSLQHFSSGGKKFIRKLERNASGGSSYTTQSCVKMSEILSPACKEQTAEHGAKLTKCIFV